MVFKCDLMQIFVNMSNLLKWIMFYGMTFRAMIGENRQLVTNERVEFEK